MTEPGCGVVCKWINTHIHRHIHMGVMRAIIHVFMFSYEVLMRGIWISIIYIINIAARRENVSLQYKTLKNISLQDKTQHRQCCHITSHHIT